MPCGINLNLEVNTAWTRERFILSQLFRISIHNNSDGTGFRSKAPSATAPTFLFLAYREDIKPSLDTHISTSRTTYTSSSKDYNHRIHQKFLRVTPLASDFNGPVKRSRQSRPWKEKHRHQ